VTGHVFISYSHKDAPYVVRLVAHLRSAGVDVWTDEGLDYGDQWPLKIERMIDSCQAFVPVMSMNSRDAAWVDREIDLAQELGKPVLPLLLSGRRFLRLRDIQDEDVTDEQMPNARFVQRLRGLTGETPTIDAASAPAAATAHPAAPAMDAHPAPDGVVRGFETGADLVARTFGPSGRRALVRTASGGLTEGADAAEVAAAVQTTETSQAIGLGYLRDLVDELRREVGDGAATAVILARAMLRTIAPAVAEGAHPVAVRRGMDAALAAATAQLAALTVDLETKEQLWSLVALATDEVVGELIAEAFDKVGREGVVIVERGNQYGFELELTEGMRFDQGHLSEYFVTAPDRDEGVLDDPYLLLVDDRLDEVEELVPVLEMVMATGQPLVVIAQDLTGPALATLIENRVRGTFISAGVKAPGVGQRRTAVLEDIAILTGAQILPLGQVRLETLGRAHRVITTRTRTTIVDGAGVGSAINQRVQELRDAINAGGPEAELAWRQTRLARLAGGVAVIKVGGRSEAELAAREHLVQRAITLAYAAVREGLVFGGGSALVHAATGLPKPTELGEDQAIGYTAVVEAMFAPTSVLIHNAGRDPSAIGAALRDQPANMTYDVVNDQFVPGGRTGMVDAAALPRTALAAAVATVGRYLMIT
jgi:chaperonin GroEL